MFRKATDADHARRDKIMARIPMNQVGKPEDIGWAAVYLASPADRYVTGTVLPVDGGAVTAFWGSIMLVLIESFKSDSAIRLRN